LEVQFIPVNSVSPNPPLPWQHSHCWKCSNRGENLFSLTLSLSPRNPAPSPAKFSSRHFLPSQQPSPATASLETGPKTSGQASPTFPSPPPASVAGKYEFQAGFAHEFSVDRSLSSVHQFRQ
ncbi:unnamed protein product, partial [Prunus brigantina]